MFAEFGWYRVFILYIDAPVLFCTGHFFVGGCMRTGIFGGSFNPPHKGHLYLGREMKKLLKLDRVIVIPAKKPPHKDGVILADDKSRLEMCSLMFTDSFFEISDIELKRDGKSYTVYTLSELKKVYPDDELFLIVGADMLLYFDKWFMWQDILKLCTLCAFARDDEHSYEELLNYSENILKSDKIIIKNVAPFKVSSTDIRNRVKKGLGTGDFLPSAVEKYITDRGLYREE